MQTLTFGEVNHATVSCLSLVNSKGFHMSLHWSSYITVNGLNITAPADSPNTDGIHISNSDNVDITNLHISTGDDCISVGPGVTNLSISRVFCGPGHGLR